VESDERELIEAHNAVLTRLRAAGIVVPEPLPVAGGADLIGAIQLPRIRAPSATRAHAVRLLRYIPGLRPNPSPSRRVASRVASPSRARARGGAPCAAMLPVSLSLPAAYPTMRPRGPANGG
jgi:hypothetical protein